MIHSCLPFYVNSVARFLKLLVIYGLERNHFQSPYHSPLPGLIPTLHIYFYSLLYLFNLHRLTVLSTLFFYFLGFLCLKYLSK